MKSKEIFEAIDLSKVGPELKMKLVALEKATEGFTNDRADARMDASLLALYNSLKEKKPEALKNVEVKTTQVEEKITKIENGKKVTRTRKTTKKVAGKKKSVKKKTPRPSQPLRKATVSNVAREIRKPGESWSDALTRAKKVFNDKKQAQSVKAKKALDDLRDFMTSDKYLKGWPRTYGKESPKNNDLVKDLSRKAEAPGRRVSKTGRVYYENRDNRSDREADNFPRKIYLKDGGAIEVGKMVRVVDNPFWENAMGKKGPFRRKVTMIDGDHVFFSDGSNSSLQYVKMELGGDVMIEPTILQNNPDYITSTATMSEYFAKGGKISSMTTYVPNRSIKELSVLLSKKLKTLKGSDVVDGVYVKNDALKSNKSTSLSSIDAIFEDVISLAKTKGLEDDINIVNKDDIQKLMDAGYDNEDIILIYFGPTALTNVNIDNEIGLGLLGYRGDFVPKAIENLIEAAKNKTYELGLKYPNFTWLDIIKKYKIDKNGKDVNGQKLTSKTSPNSSAYYIYRIFEGDKVVVGTSIDRIRILNGKKIDDDSYRRDLEEVNNFEGGYWGVVSSDKKIIKDITKMILRKKSGYVKDMDIFINFLGGVDANTLDLNKIPYELGGEVMLEPTILQNNPDYITSTATMSDYFEKGGMMAKAWGTPSQIEDDLRTQIINLFIYRGIADKLEDVIYTDQSTDKGIKWQIEVIGKDTDIIHAYNDGKSRGQYEWYLNNKRSSKADIQQYFLDKYISDSNIFAKGGNVESMDKAWEVKVMRDDEVLETFMVRGRNRGEAREVVEDYHEDKMERKHGEDIFFAIEEAPAKFADGGAIGFDALAKKVAKRYARKKVKPEYQDEYGKTYSDEEAMEVGRKVAAKVYRQQQAKMAKGGFVSKGEMVWRKLTPSKRGEFLNENFTPQITPRTQEILVNKDYQFLPTEVKMVVERVYANVEEYAKGGGFEKKDEYYFSVRNSDAKDVWEMVDYWFGNDIDRGRIEVLFQKNKYVIKDYELAKRFYQYLRDRGVKFFDQNFVSESVKGRDKFAKGGAMEHMIMAGDEVLAIHKNMLIVESNLGGINVIDLSTEPIARRILIEPITGKNTLTAAKEHIDYLVSRKPKTMAMGGSLEAHGLEEGDLIVEDEGAYINVLSEDGKIFYVDIGRGLRETEPPLPFEHGGEVKKGDIARLAAKYNKTGQEVAAAISEGAHVEVEHTKDRKKATRIAVDHLEEDFYYYPKLKAAEGQVDFSDFYEGGGQVPEQFLDSKGERKIDKKSIAELTDYVMALPQTKSIYFNEDTQEYVPSRRKLHADIINKFKKEVVCITKGQPIAIFMGGSPASGKSSFLRKYSPYLLKEEILKVDADEIRAMLPEYDGYNASQTHLETKDIVNTLLSNKNIGIPCDFDLIYDGTMNSVKSYIPLMDILRKRGYKIFIVYMDKVPKDVIINRALERYKKSGRFVPLEVIEDFFEKGKTAFNQLKKEVDGYMVIDGSNQDYEIIEQGGFKLPTNRLYSKLGTKIDAKDIPLEYKKGAFLKKD